MTIKVHRAPPGLDYDPVTGAFREISFGIVRSTPAEPGSHQLTDVMARRLFPGRRPEGEPDWSGSNAERWEVLLPGGAPDRLWQISELCSAYHYKADGMIRDLAAVVTVRWGEVESRSATLPLHDAWESSRIFARRLVERLSVAAVIVLHVPARSWAKGSPHVHLILPSRIVRPGTGFATFCLQLTRPLEGRALIDAEWASHIGSTDRGNR